MSCNPPLDAVALESLLSGLPPAYARLFTRALEGEALTRADAALLFRAEGPCLDALGSVADFVRRTVVGDAVSFVVNRNINFTNVCYMGCRFCNFSRRMEDSDAVWLPLEEIARRAREAADLGATEVCLQGGLHPRMPKMHYRNIVRAIREAAPELHIHAFSPFEIWFASKRLQRSPEWVLQDLQEHGLDSLPGTAAEILDQNIRRRLTRGKLPAEDWMAIVRAAHRIGLPTTATIMYGHIDGPEAWALHFDRLRDIQRETGGFTEFVPLGFVHYKTRLYLEDGARPGPSSAEHLRMHAVARLFFRNSIDNIQVSWVKMGPEAALKLLDAGVNDLGGTLMDENISRSAGAPFGQQLTPSEMVRLIQRAGRIPVRRNTRYDILEQYDNGEPVPRLAATP